MEISNEQKISYVQDKLQFRPFVSNESLKNILSQCYGLELDEQVEPKELVSYDDRNFLIKGSLRGQEKRRYILKLFSFGSVTPQFLKLESKLTLDCHSKLNEYFAVPVPIKVKGNDKEIDDGDYTSYIGSYDLPLQENAVFEGCSKEELINKGLIRKTTGRLTCHHLTRLVHFIEGKIPENITNENLIQSWAKNTARLANFFQNHKKDLNESRGCWVWNMIGCPNLLKSNYLPRLPIPDCDKETSLQIIEEFQNNSLPLMNKELQQTYIHGDLNEQNLVVDDNEFVIGVIDFDDLVWSYSIIDVATAMMYLAVSVDPSEVLEKLNLFYKSYISIRQLSDVEKSLLYNLILMRFVQSSSVSLYQMVNVDPHNEYLSTHGPGKCRQYINYFIRIGRNEFMAKVFDI